MAVLLTAAVVAPALAWEFEMKGEYEYRLRYFARMGNTDLFGQFPLQDGGAGTYIGFAGPRIYARGAAAAGGPVPLLAVLQILLQQLNTAFPASDNTGWRQCWSV